jgi:hypothetical protein
VTEAADAETTLRAECRLGLATGGLLIDQVLPLIATTSSMSPAILGPNYFGHHFLLACQCDQQDTQRFIPPEGTVWFDRLRRFEDR